MPLIEATIQRRPDYVLRNWRVGVLRVGSGSIYSVSGFNFKDGWEMESGVIKFFDSAQRLMLDVDGVVWHLPEGAHHNSDLWDRTEEVLTLIAQRSSNRNTPQLTEEQESELHRLTLRE